MKEYLTKKSDGTYTLTLGGGDIEVPEGADGFYFNKNGHRNCDFFYKYEDGVHYYRYCLSKKWMSWRDFDSYEELKDFSLVWQRHTQPEELPFIDDDEISIGVDMAKDDNGDYTIRHLHYFKDVSDIDTMDVYEVLYRFCVTDPCLQHIVKKALCAGQRGHKNFETDLQNIRDTAIRAIEINCKP